MNNFPGDDPRDGSRLRDGLGWNRQRILRARDEIGSLTSSVLA